MRFYLDTNILAFLTGQDRGDSIGDDIQMLLNDYSVDILASAVCYQELVHLFQIGKLRRPQRGRLDGGASAFLRLSTCYLKTGSHSCLSPIST